MTQIWITGASSGIGRACAEQLSKPGTILTLLARRDDRLAEVKAKCLSLGASQVETVSVDLMDWASIQDWWSQRATSEQSPDVLIHNAGLARGRDLIQQTPLPTRDGLWSGFQEMIDTNLKAVIGLTQLALPGMIVRKSGHILHLGSIAGHETYPAGHLYSATKHAVRAWSKSLRLDLLGTGIRVTSIDPGMVETEFSRVRFYGDQARATQVYADFTPLRPEDIAKCVQFAVDLPTHVCIEELTVMPTDQGSANHVYRKPIPRE